jgi:hypothetical protein
MHLFPKFIYAAWKKEALVFKDEFFEVKNEDSNLSICKVGMPSISITPNKNVKWTETAMVSRCFAADSDCCIWGDGDQHFHSFL